jgi:hypothetical protein
MIKERTQRSSSNSTGGFYEALHPLLNFANDFDHADHTANAHKSTGITAPFEINGKSNHILLPNQIN